MLKRKGEILMRSNGKLTAIKLKDELNAKGCEQGRLQTEIFNQHKEQIKTDVNNLGIKVDKNKEELLDLTKSIFKDLKGIRNWIIIQLVAIVLTLLGAFFWALFNNIIKKGGG